CRPSPIHILCLFKTQGDRFFRVFQRERQKDPLSAVKCLENEPELCLANLPFPRKEWICLQTTKAIERINKEFQRKTKHMEIITGECFCYTLSIFVCLQMELRWKSKTI